MAVLHAVITACELITIGLALAIQPRDISTASLDNFNSVVPRQDKGKEIDCDGGRGLFQCVPEQGGCYWNRGGAFGCCNEVDPAKCVAVTECIPYQKNNKKTCHSSDRGCTSCMNDNVGSCLTVTNIGMGHHKILCAPTAGVVSTDFKFGAMSTPHTLVGSGVHVSSVSTTTLFTPIPTSKSPSVIADSTVVTPPPVAVSSIRTSDKSSETQSVNSLDDASNTTPAIVKSSVSTIVEYSTPTVTSIESQSPGPIPYDDEHSIRRTIIIAFSTLAALFIAIVGTVIFCNKLKFRRERDAYLLHMGIHGSGNPRARGLGRGDQLFTHRSGAQILHRHSSILPHNNRSNPRVSWPPALHRDQRGSPDSIELNALPPNNHDSPNGLLARASQSSIGSNIDDIGTSSSSDNDNNHNTGGGGNDNDNDNPDDNPSTTTTTKPLPALPPSLRINPPQIYSPTASRIIPMPSLLETYTQAETRNQTQPHSQMQTPPRPPTPMPPPLRPTSVPIPVPDFSLYSTSQNDAVRRKSSAMLSVAGPYLTADRAYGRGYWEAEREQLEADGVLKRSGGGNGSGSNGVAAGAGEKTNGEKGQNGEKKVNGVNGDNGEKVRAGNLEDAEVEDWNGGWKKMKKGKRDDYDDYDDDDDDEDKKE